MTKTHSVLSFNAMYQHKIHLDSLDSLRNGKKV